MSEFDPKVFSTSMPDSFNPTEWITPCHQREVPIGCGPGFRRT